MKRVMRASQMKACDFHMIETIGIPSLVLMERAADACIRELFKVYPGQVRESKVLCVCGSGNNGGDGFACARILALKGVQAEVLFAGKMDHRSKECALQMEICQRLGIPILTEADLSGFDIIIDALFGIGLDRKVRDPYRTVIEGINQADGFVLAVDIPSGVAADTGQVLGCAVQADLTVSMQFLKPGLLLPPGAKCAGLVRDADIGIMESDGADAIYMPELADLKDLLPRRERFGNKGTFGKILVIAGSENMAGASWFAARSALLTGCGMVKIMTVPMNRVILQEMLPEAMLVTYETKDEALAALPAALSWADCVLAGPGMGNTDRTAAIIEELLKEASCPLVLDADGLNVLAGRIEILDSSRGDFIITPHMGEMSRLTGLSVEKLKDDPIRCASDFAVRHKLTCILKDARTVTACPDGGVYLNTLGNSGMATAGSGDTLAGIVASMTVQGAPACTGVLLHAAAGDKAAEKIGLPGLTAGKLAEAAAEVYKEQAG